MGRKWPKREWSLWIICDSMMGRIIVHAQQQYNNSSMPFFITIIIIYSTTLIIKLFNNKIIISIIINNKIIMLLIFFFIIYCIIFILILLLYYLLELAISLFFYIQKNFKFFLLKFIFHFVYVVVDIYDDDLLPINNYCYLWSSSFLMLTRCYLLSTTRQPCCQ